MSGYEWTVSRLLGGGVQWSGRALGGTSVWVSNIGSGSRCDSPRVEPDPGQQRQRSPCATPAPCTPSASAAAGPDNPSPCSSTAYTSPSSTPTPANSCASSPSTPPADVNPKTRSRANPEGSPCRRCLETSQERAEGIRTPNLLIRRKPGFRPGRLVQFWHVRDLRKRPTPSC